MKQPVYVIDIVRTPVGKFGGTLAAVRPDDLAAHVILAILQRYHMDAGEWSTGAAVGKRKLCVPDR